MMKRMNWIALGMIILGGVSVSRAQSSGAQMMIISQEGSISGTIIDKETGAPVQHCRIALHSMMPEYHVMETGSSKQAQSFRLGSIYCSAFGEFSFTNLWTGLHSYELEIQSPIYRKQTVRGRFVAGANDWGIIEVSERPFYFLGSFLEDRVAHVTVMNTTGKRAYMRFWLTGELTRTDDSPYNGCKSVGPLRLQRKGGGYRMKATYRLVPGENTIQLLLEDYGLDIRVSNVQISGGRSYSSPSMVSKLILSMRDDLDVDCLPSPIEGIGPVTPIPLNPPFTGVPEDDPDGCLLPGPIEEVGPVPVIPIPLRTVEDSDVVFLPAPIEDVAPVPIPLNPLFGAIITQPRVFTNVTIWPLQNIPVIPTNTFLWLHLAKPPRTIFSRKTRSKESFLVL